MASQIYTKGSEKTLVLAPRAGDFRQFNLGDDWTEMRLGMFVSAVAATGPNDNNVNETLTPSTVADYPTFGIKNSGQALPGQTDSLFIGIRTPAGSNVVSSAGSGIGDASGNWRAFTAVGTTLDNGGSNFIGARLGQCDPTGSTAYCTFFAIKIVINNRGLSSQTVSISGSATNTGVAGNDYSAIALRTSLNNATYGSAQTLDWNDGVSARDIPDCIFVRSPLFLNAPRISAIRGIRYAP